MKLSTTRVRAIVRKELREYRRNRQLVVTMAVLPLIFIIAPAVQIFTQPAAAASTLAHDHVLVYMLGIPALVRATFASISIAGERQQGTLELVAQVLFTPLLAALSIWIGIAISARSNDPRVAAQLSVLASLPAIFVWAFVAFGKIHVSVPLALALGAALLLLDVLGWRIVSPAFDRERLTTGTR